MGNEVHIWLASVDDAPLNSPLGLLDDGERVQASRFRFERDRTRFVGRRAFRRRVLALYLNLEPSSVGFWTTSTGRPEVESRSGIAFSSSHSDGLAVVAVTRGGRVGVDVERLRPVPEAQELADRLFSPPEADQLRSCEEAARAGAFLAFWARKESYVKAIGAGLSMALDAFEVCGPVGDGVGRPVRVGEADPIVVRDVELVPGFVSAVAVSGADAVVLPGTLAAARAWATR